MDQALNQKIDAYIAENKEQLLQDIAALVAIDSVEGTPEEGAPFGAVAWYEQKAVIVLLALLSLGVKKIHLGPTLPAFLSPNVAKVLVDTFQIGTISDVEDDLKIFQLS